MRGGRALFWSARGFGVGLGRSRYVRGSWRSFGTGSRDEKQKLQSFIKRENKRVAVGGLVLLGIGLVYRFGFKEQIPLAIQKKISLAHAAEQNGDMNSALKYFRQAICELDASPFKEKSSIEAKAKLQFGSLLKRSGHLVEARRAFREVTETPSVDDEILHLKGVALDNLGQICEEENALDDAKTKYLQAVEKIAHNPEVLQKTWKIFSEANGDPVVNKNFQLEASRARDLAGTLNNLGMLYIKEGRIEEGKEILKRCVAVLKVHLGNEDEATEKRIVDFINAA